MMSQLKNLKVKAPHCRQTYVPLHQSISELTSHRLQNKPNCKKCDTLTIDRLGQTFYCPRCNTREYYDNYTR